MSMLFTSSTLYECSYHFRECFACGTGLEAPIYKDQVLRIYFQMSSIGESIRFHP